MLGDVIAEIVVRSSRLFRIIVGVPAVLFEGFWLGILPERIADAVTTLSYGNGREYSNEAWLNSGFHFWEELAVQRFFPPGGRVLVAAAGAGREMIALAGAGYPVDGFDCSQPMVAAEQRALGARGVDGSLIWSPPSTVPQHAPPYDAAIVGWNGFSYISPRGRRVDFLRALRAHLTVCAPVLISVGLLGKIGAKARWVPALANFIRVMTLRKPVFETGDSFPGRPRHDFTLKQLRQELAEAGFSIRAYYRWGPFGAVIALPADYAGVATRR